MICLWGGTFRVKTATLEEERIDALSRGTIADWAALGLPFQSQGEKAIGVLGEQVGSLKIPDCQGTVVDTCFPLQWMTALHYTFFPITFVPSVETEEAGRLLLDYRREKVTSYEYRG